MSASSSSLPRSQADGEQGSAQSHTTLTSRASLTFWLTVGGVVLLLAFLGYAMIRASDREATSFSVQSALRNIPVTARPAPDFTLPLFDGTTLQLSDLRGRPMLVDFWASWCVPCREEAATLEQVWQSYRETDLLFVGVGVQDREAAARAFLDEFAITYPNGRDGDGRVSIDYGLMGVPEKFLINRQGEIVRKLIGPVPAAVLADLLDELVRGDYE
ncbi:MAG: hypothetical protein CL878_06230 [Dehalococcoidia bacterium]|nr:hypothetical protein [Dehalococcoidia bacterium]